MYLIILQFSVKLNLNLHVFLQNGLVHDIVEESLFDNVELQCTLVEHVHLHHVENYRLAMPGRIENKMAWHASSKLNEWLAYFCLQRKWLVILVFSKLLVNGPQ